MNRDALRGGASLALLMLAGATTVVVPDQAQAACSPLGTSGITVTCTGTGLPAFVSTAVPGITLNIVDGASITGAQTTGGTASSPRLSSVAVGAGSTINNAGTILNDGMRQGDNIAVNLAGTATTLNNTGTIGADFSTTSSSTGSRLYGVYSSAPGGAFDTVNVINRGTISLTQSSAGVARGVYAGENIGTFTLDNFDAILVVKNGNPTTAVVAGVDAGDTARMIVANHTGASISVTGGNTYALGGRAFDYTVQNDGLISTAAGAVSPAGRAAILIYGGSPDAAGTATIDNSRTGTIVGNVSITDTSPFGTTLPTTTAQTRDSTFTNEGVITGAFVYGAGTHTLDNTGRIGGGITVDQQVGSASGAPITGIGGASFRLTTAGTLGGDIAIADRPDSVNSITLIGTGYAAGGNITTTGLGSNSLVLNGVASLGSVQNFSSLDLRTSNVAVARGVSLVDGAQIATTIFGNGGTLANPTTRLGSIQGALTLQGNATVTPSFVGIARNGDAYALATSASASVAGTVTVGRTDLVSFAPITAAGGLTLQASVRDARTVPGITSPGAQTINGLTSYGGLDPRVQALGGRVENLQIDAQVAAAARALTPIVNGSDVQSTVNSALVFQQQIDARLDNFMYAQLPVSGRSADLGVARPAPVYGAPPVNGAWIEGIGGGVHQSSRAGIDGYTSTVSGVIGGYDRLVLPTVRVGGAFGFVNSDVATILTGSRQTIQTYQGQIYGTYEGKNSYLRGSVGYGGVDFQQSRQIAFAGFADTAFAHHSGNIFTARGEGGLPIEVRTALVVPYAAFTYNRLVRNAYSETSLFGSGLAYNGISNNSERSEVGGKVIVPVDVPFFARLLPGRTTGVALEARAAYVHEFGNVAQSVAANFVGGGGVFIATGPTPDRDMVDYGVGLRVATGPVQFDVSYNGLARNSYLQQVGILRARYVF